MNRRKTRLRPLEIVSLAVGLAWVLTIPFAHAGNFFSVDPSRISAGMFYDGATLHVRGSVGEDSQVVIRIKGASEHHVFNRRGKIGGIVWGGIEHVTFRHAPSFYAVYTSAALATTATPALRAQLQLGYDPLEAQMDVEGTKVDKHVMISHFVAFKESEGLYRIVPGAVHLEDPERGLRAFDVTVPLPASTPPGDLQVSVFELARGAVIREEAAAVKLERVGLPAELFRLAHENGLLFGLLALFVTVTTGVIVDFLGRVGRRGALHNRGPILDVAADLHRLVAEGLFSVRVKPRSPAAVERLHEKYRLFRNLLTLNNELLELLAELEEESSWSSLRHPRVRMGIRALFDGTEDMVQVLNQLTGNRYFDLKNVIASVRADVLGFLEKMPEQEGTRLTLPLREISSKTADQVGGKAVNLARLECDLKMRVPESFVVTTEAYRQLLEVEGLAGKLRAVLAPARLDAPDDFRRRCEMAQGLVREAYLPPAVGEAIRAAYRASGIPAGEGVAVRSSAAGEDSELSFAGQFETLLNVPESEVPEAWRQVVMSRFSPRAVFYRRAAGLAEVDTPMAVLVQRMVRARTSGVLFTRRPEHPKAPELLITAVRGLGLEVSAGIANADEFVVSRTQPPRILERRIARKPVRLVSGESGGVTRLAEADEEQDRAAVTDEEVLRLAEAGLSVERYFRSPQDIEWAIDGDGELFMMQARPIRTDKAKASPVEAPRGAVLLLHGGEPVWPGRAVGPVHVARSPEEENRVPTGALLVVPQLLPDCVRLLPRVCGIVVERGTVTGHAASILREFRVPSLFGVTGALDKLVSGQVVSLDVASRSVFEGVLWPELRQRLAVRLLGRRTTGLPEVLAGRLTKLSGSGFMGTWACQSLHDVIRFAHEMAIQSMFDIGDRLLDSPVGGVKRLDSPSPAYMHIVDLGGGLRSEAASKRTVKPEDVVSVPFQGLWRGLSDPRFVRRSDIPAQSFRSAFGTGLASTGPREGGSPNYACITESYLNLNSRQAHHFAIVDAFLSDNQNNNHVSLRMKGGGGAPWQRNLRAELVAEILRLHHFTVDVTGDLVNGWARGLDLTTGADKLTMIGHLLSFSALLDLWITGEAQMKRYVAEFVEAEARRSEGSPEPEPKQV
jgi:pyruvate,water dikinase